MRSSKFTFGTSTNPQKILQGTHELVHKNPRRDPLKYSTGRWTILRDDSLKIRISISMTTKNALKGFVKNWKSTIPPFENLFDPQKICGWP